MRLCTRRPGLLVLLAALLSLSGCGGGLELAEVTGTVTLNGQPLPGVTVTFMPDPDKGNTVGRSSSGLTNKAGRYRLIYSGERPRPGAVVGWNKVIVEDTAAENYRPGEPVADGDARPGGAPLAVRVPPRYTTARDTPLAFEVKPGSQAIDIELK